MSFYHWILEQTHRNDPIGDLAKDIELDFTETKVKRKPRTLDQWEAHLGCRGCSYVALVTLEEAYKEYVESVHGS